MHGERASLAVAREDGGAEVLLHLRGELDVSTCALLQAVLDPLVASRRRPPMLRLRVDMAGVGFADASGLSPLLHARAVLVGRGGTVQVLDPGRPVRRVLDVLGLAEMVARRTA